MPGCSPSAASATTGRLVSRIDAERSAIVFADGEKPYDLLAVVPPHRAPRAVVDAGLVDQTGYIPVHPQTLELLSDPEDLDTRHPGLHAIGDVTSVRLLNGMLLPKAGVFVEAQARVVAENIAARRRGERAGARFDGSGFCYIETGDGMAGYGSGDFYAYPGPRVSLQPPSHEFRLAKEAFIPLAMSQLRPRRSDSAPVTAAPSPTRRDRRRRRRPA